MSQREVLTIGHSNHSIERFVALLRQHGVTAVADVRSKPYSGFNPQFSRQALEWALRDADISYVFLGKELGARSEDPACYDKGRVSYDRLSRTGLFREGLDRVKKGAVAHKIALMCAEKEPLECHRTLLVSRALDRDGVSVAHILADGRLESHRDSLIRLLGLVGLPSEDLFKSQDELIEQACVKQEIRVAYIDEQAAKESTEAGS